MQDIYTALAFGCFAAAAVVATALLVSSVERAWRGERKGIDYDVACQCDKRGA